jgi:hypothetical protein
MMETFGVLANDDNEKVYSKVAEKCLEIAKK